MNTSFPPRKSNPRRVLQPTTAATMRSLLEGVVLEGTGPAARLDGYTAAGKTGTAQKIDPATGRYSAHAGHCFICWFCADKQSFGHDTGDAGFTRRPA